MRTISILTAVLVASAFSQNFDEMYFEATHLDRQSCYHLNYEIGRDMTWSEAYNNSSIDTVVETAELITDTVIETTPEIDSAKLEFQAWMASMEAEADSLKAVRETRAQALAQYSETEINLASSLGFHSPADAIKAHGKRQFAKWLAEIEKNYRLILIRSRYGEAETRIAIDGEILE